MRLVLLVGCLVACSTPKLDNVVLVAPVIDDTGFDSPLDADADADADSDSDADADADSDSDALLDEPCPTGVICLAGFPASHRGDTATSTSDVFDGYSCSPATAEAGREVLYRIAVEERGLISLQLSNLDSGADIDVHLLATPDAGDCISRGHWLAGGYVERGYYWVVADSWTSSSGVEMDGAYTLDVGFVAVSSLASMGIAPGPADDALYAMGVAFQNEAPDRLFYGITDFSLHSSERRFWLIDLLEGTLLYNLPLTHGEGSSDATGAFATSFSNINESHQSSLGMMKGAELYSGMWGNSMRIDGFESAYNGLVRPRAIVMHGAEYAREDFADTYGRLGESWGCPAIDDREVDAVMSVLSEGSMLMFWYPDGDWSVHSDYLY